MINIAVFASGSGSNAEAIIKHFNLNPKHGALVNFVITNKKDAGVINRIKKLGIGSFYFSNNEFIDSTRLVQFLKENSIDLIVLAGFLKPIPIELIQLYPQKIINIHPALLPKYGGKGMFGNHVHEAVIKNNEKESGITIHYVIEEYDKGEIIFQAKCEVTNNETIDSLAAKIHQLEHKHFPETIEKVLTSL